MGSNTLPRRLSTSWVAKNTLYIHRLSNRVARAHMTSAGSHIQAVARQLPCAEGGKAATGGSQWHASAARVAALA
eukprot:364502-Chlamydomonas_euryale.AAC.4